MDKFDALKKKYSQLDPEEKLLIELLIDSLLKKGNPPK